MNVLFVNECCGFLGGVEQNVADTAAGLRARGHRCMLAHAIGRIGRDPASYVQHFDAAYACDDLNALPAGGGTLAEVITAVQPDAVFLHKVPRSFDYSVLKGVRTVRMVHDHDVCCPRRHKYTAWSGRVCTRPVGWHCYLDGGFLARDTGSLLGLRVVSISDVHRELKSLAAIDGIVVASRFMREELRVNGINGERIHVLPPMVRLDPVPPTPVPHSPHVLYVGQLVRGKGVDLLLRALARLNRPLQATIVGSGNARDTLERQCRRLRLNDRVRFTGWMDHSALQGYYSSARVVVVPSRWPEPFGMVGLEAMHHGRPVVAFATGGIPDWLEDGVTGLLAPAQRVPALAAAIDSLLRDDQLASTLGRNARRRLGERFQFESYLDRLENILDPAGSWDRRRVTVLSPALAAGGLS